jgi:positive regulator of sigma E activity
MSRCDAVVVEVSGGEAWSNFRRVPPVAATAARPSPCQEGLIGSAGVRRYRLANSIGARVGDRVQLTIADGGLWQASLASYVLPLLLAIGRRHARPGKWVAMVGRGRHLAWLICRPAAAAPARAARAP